MIRRLIGLLAILAIDSARAQTEISLGSHISHPAPAEIPIRGNLSQQDKARATILAFSMCIVATNRRNVELTLALPPTDDTVKRKFVSLATSNCLRYGMLEMPYSLLRGGLFAALYRADFSKSAPATGLKSIDLSQTIDATTNDKATEYVALLTFADCVVRAAPADSRALLLASVGSRAESMAFAALAPRLNECLGKGQTITFSKSALSAYLAEAAYREAAQSGVVSRGKVN